MQIVSLSLHRFATPGARLWAFAMMGFARLPLSRMPGLEFWKLCGSGPDNGFTLKFNPSVYTMLCAWPDLETAQRTLNEAPLFARYRDMAAESGTLFLQPISARGNWSGKEPFRPSLSPTGEGPIAALTRATLRPRIARRFWSRVPDINDVIGADPNVMFKIGMGEVPALHQVTFSIWPDMASMARFARWSGPHAEAIRAVRKEGWFQEELYARFRVVNTQGIWGGRDLCLIQGKQV